MESLLTKSGTEMARMIRQGEISSRQAVQTHIDRIIRINPTLNAMVAKRFDQALAEADQADERLAQGTGDLPPFFGVPCTIKECFALTGMPNASGLIARKKLVSKNDATAVKRIRQSGAIPLGVTNTSELCMWMETNNKLYGRTNNPYNPAHIVGGSSGGEGAIIGGGGSPFGLGSDIGGSIRMPAFFNGVFGHKPTGGLVPGTGQHPLAAPPARRYLTTGPLARRAQDLWPLLKILAGPDGTDEGCFAMELGDPDQVDLSTLTVTSIEDNGRIKVSDELIIAQRKVADYLASCGANVRTAKLPALKNSLDIWSNMLSAAGGDSFAEMLGEGRPIKPWRELGRLLIGRSDHTLPAISLALTEKLPKMMPRRVQRSVQAGQALKKELTDLIGENGILLYPSYPVPAPKHKAPLLLPFHWVYTAILNVMEIPVTQVPLGLGQKGLPLGIQVGALHGQDHLTIAVAQELEKQFGGWVWPQNL